MTEFEQHELIERYLLKKMNEEELKAFNLLRSQNPDLQREIDRQTLLIQQIRQKGRNEIQDRMKKLHSELKPELNSIFEQERNTIKPEPKYDLIKEDSFVDWKWVLAVSVFIASCIWAYFSLIKPSPKIVALVPTRVEVAYKSEQISESQGLAGKPQADSTYPVLIYPPTDSTFYHYRFDDSLRLYGKFDPPELELTHNITTGTYLLRVDSSTYLLERYEPVKPLKQP